MAQQFAQNSFNGGLQMDTSPLLQGLSTLSYALNATLLTMNGNENVLQNDMGNARVDNAFLPSGYVPIGMKEYGGVIYVAAYNPITNRGQLGSFPSPERKLGPEYDGLKSGDIDINYFFNEPNGEGFNIENEITDIDEASTLKTDIILVPLVNYEKNSNLLEDINVIRAGDKFSFYEGENLENLENLYIRDTISKFLSNYNNIKGEGEKANLLKNNIITFSIGILNSQNEFVDITPSLKRFDGTSIIDDKEEDSSIDIFNKGYFIGGKKPEPSNDKTKGDKALIAERQALPVNTYGKKLVGPLYLKMQLNTIQSFNYAISGYKSGDKYSLCIYSYYTYNFPDGFFGNSNLEDSYLEYGYINDCLILNEGLVTDPEYSKDNYGPITFYKIDGNKGLTDKEENTNISYNKFTKLYSIQNKHKIKLEDPSSTIIDYTLLPGMTFGGMTNLEVTGSIDLNKIGTGIFQLNNWRYYNSDNSITLTYGWESYPMYNSKIKNVKFEFYDIIDIGNGGNTDPVMTYYVEDRESYNGVFTETFDIDTDSENSLSSRTLYLVKISHDVEFGESSLLPSLEEWETFEEAEDEGVLNGKKIEPSFFTTEKPLLIKYGSGNAHIEDQKKSLVVNEITLERDNSTLEDYNILINSEEAFKYRIGSDGDEYDGKSMEIINLKANKDLVIIKDGASGVKIKGIYVMPSSYIEDEYRFLLTTPLFNNCYYANSDEFIKDYGKPRNDDGNIFPLQDGVYEKQEEEGAGVKPRPDIYPDSIDVKVNDTDMTLSLEPFLNYYLLPYTEDLPVYGNDEEINDWPITITYENKKYYKTTTNQEGNLVIDSDVTELQGQLYSIKEKDYVRFKETSSDIIIKYVAVDINEQINYIKIGDKIYTKTQPSCSSSLETVNYLGLPYYRCSEESIEQTEEILNIENFRLLAAPHILNGLIIWLGIEYQDSLPEITPGKTVVAIQTQGDIKYGIVPEESDDIETSYEEKYYTGEAKIYYEKLNILFNGNTEYKDFGTSSEKQYGGISSISEDILRYGYVKSHNINLRLNYNIEVDDKSYYPKEIEIEDITSGATIKPIFEKEKEVSSSKRRLQANSGTVKHQYFRTVDEETAIRIGEAGGGTGGTKGNNRELNPEDVSSEVLLVNTLETEDQESRELTATKGYIEILMEWNGQQKKVGNNKEEEEWTTFHLGDVNENNKPYGKYVDPDDPNSTFIPDDEFQLCFGNLNFNPDTGAISGNIDLYDKCIVYSPSTVDVYVATAFESIYDYLEKGFSMYNGRLYGYLLKAYGKHKGIGVVANKEIGRYYRPKPEDENREVRRGTSYWTNKWNTDELDPFKEKENSFVMTFNSSSYKNDEGWVDPLDEYEYFNVMNNTGKYNRVIDLGSLKEFGIKNILNIWDSKNQYYSLVGMINADYLGTTVEDWNDNLRKLSNSSQFCRIWWKTNKEGEYALFPKMWRNTKVGNQKLKDIWDSKPDSLKKIGGQLFMYNTPLSESIGEADADEDNNIFKHYMNNFVFTFGKPKDVEMYITRGEEAGGGYTYIDSAYEVKLIIRAYLEYIFEGSNANNVISSYNNLLENGIKNLLGENQTYIRKELAIFKLPTKFELKLSELPISYWSSNKVSGLVSESLNLLNATNIVMDVSTGATSDVYGRPLKNGAIYLVNSTGGLEQSNELSEYFDINTESNKILVEAKKVEKSSLQYSCLYMSLASKLTESENLKAKAVEVFPKMKIEYPVFKIDAEDTHNWESV